MTRRTIRAELDRFSVTLTGPKVRAAVDRAGVPCMAHATRPHRHGALQVRCVDLGEILAAAESLGVPVEVVDRDGTPVPVGGLLTLGSG